MTKIGLVYFNLFDKENKIIVYFKCIVKIVWKRVENE